eukprot:6458968-Amphidinium_carterae.2
MHGTQSACAWLAQKKWKVLQAVTHKGQRCVTTAEIDAALIDYWSEVGAYWAEGKTKCQQSVDALVEQHFPQQPPIVKEALTDQMFATALKRMRKKSSPGPGGWYATDLWALPPTATTQFRELCQAIEEQQYLPKRWRTAWTSFIPKSEEDMTIDKVRPISVCSQLLRWYARVLCSQHSKHIERHLLDAQYGARAGRSTRDVCLRIRTDFDLHRHRQRKVYALQVDLVKAFNTIDPHAACRVLERIAH